jgi:hypothetical protein
MTEANNIQQKDIEQNIDAIADILTAMYSVNRAAALDIAYNAIAQARDYERVIL